MDYPLPDKTFKKFNIKLLEKTKYKSKFDILFTEKFKSFNISFNETKRKIQKAQIHERKSLINNIYNIFLVDIFDVLKEAVGDYDYSPYCTKGYWTNEMKEVENKIIESTRYALLCPDFRVEHNNMIKIQKKKLINLASVQSKKRYKKLKFKVENYDHTIAYKIIKSIQHRESGKGCQLNVGKMEDYSNHFRRNTFGKIPQVSFSEEEHNTMAETDNEKVFNMEDLPLGSKLELKKLIDQMAKAKSSGIDDFKIEIIKNPCELLLDIIYKLFQLFFMNNTIPDLWNEVAVIPIFKKGDDKLIENHRPISLSSQLRRLFERLLLKHINIDLISLLHPSQGGFLKARSTSHQITLLDQIMKKHNATAVFLDLMAAYDSVPRSLLWYYLITKLPKSKRSLRIVQYLRILFDDNISRLQIHGKRGLPIINHSGLLQGSSISPILFNIFLNPLIEALEKLPGDINIGGIKINSIFYADDGCLVGKSRKLLQDQLKVCDLWAEESGMNFAPKKCQVLNNKNFKRKLILNNQELDFIEEFKYLGCPFNDYGIDNEKLLKDSIKCVKFYTTWLMKRNLADYGLKMKSNLFNTFISSRIEYCIQNCNFTLHQIEKLDKVRRWSLKCLMGLPGSTSNLGIHLLSNTLPISTRIQEAKGRYLFSISQLQYVDKNIPIYRIYANEKCRIEKERLPFFKEGLKNKLYLKLYNRKEDQSYKNCIKEFRLNEIGPILLENPLNIAGTISKAYLPLNYNSIRRPKIFKYKMSLENQKILTKWMLGKYTFHQPCKKINPNTNNPCNYQLSRKHGTYCAGIEDDSRYSNYTEPVHLNKIDIMIASFNEKEDGKVQIKKIIKAIKRVIITCITGETFEPP